MKSAWLKSQALFFVLYFNKRLALLVLKPSRDKEVMPMSESSCICMGLQVDVSRLCAGAVL